MNNSNDIREGVLVPKVFVWIFVALLIFLFGVACWFSAGYLAGEKQISSLKADNAKMTSEHDLANKVLAETKAELSKKDGENKNLQASNSELEEVNANLTKENGELEKKLADCKPKPKPKPTLTPKPVAKPKPVVTGDGAKKVGVTYRNIFGIAVLGLPGSKMDGKTVCYVSLDTQDTKGCAEVHILPARSGETKMDWDARAVEDAGYKKGTKFDNKILSDVIFSRPGR